MPTQQPSPMPNMPVGDEFPFDDYLKGLLVPGPMVGPSGAISMPKLNNKPVETGGTAEMTFPATPLPPNWYG